MKVYFTKDKIKEALLALIAIFALYGTLAYFKIGCPIKFLTGISCAGCGMTRAWLALLRGDFAAAFHYHPLFFLVPPALLILMLRHKLPKLLYRFLIFTIIAAFVIVYLYRLRDPKDLVVTIDLSNNLFFRLYQLLN